jgi:hypothetical protein
MMTRPPDDRRVEPPVEAIGLRALHKSDEQTRARNLPRLLGRGALADERTGEVIGRRLEYSVASRTTGGTVYIVFVELPRAERARFRCTCPGGDVGRDCWHRVHVMRALAGHIGQIVLPEVDEDDY